MSERTEKTRLSYKFQRLREKLRAAVASGELSGKLPGERVLARRFHVNAKTLSKALTDLAAEGVLDRSIGRGTFVEGTAPASAAQERWLIICDADQLSLPQVKLLAAANQDSQIVTDLSGIRPSFMNQFSAVIDFARATPVEFLRDAMLRHVRLVAVGREPQTYSISAVIADRAMAVAKLTRDLLLAGHRKFGVIEDRGQTIVADGVRRTAQRFAMDTTIDVGDAKDAALLVENGATALICNTPSSAQSARAALDAAGVAVPGSVSVVGVGVSDAIPCTGYFVSPQAIAESVTQLLREPPLRPTTLWLTANFHDSGTISTTHDNAELPPDDLMTMTL